MAMIRTVIESHIDEINYYFRFSCQEAQDLDRQQKRLEEEATRFDKELNKSEIDAIEAKNR